MQCCACVLAWQSQATPAVHQSMAFFAGRLYAVGDMTSTRQRLATVEAYDPREGRCTLFKMSTSSYALKCAVNY